MVACTPGSSRPVELAVIGLGLRGRKHLAAARDCALARVVAICDSSAAAVPPTDDCITTADPWTLLERADVEAAILAVPHGAYFELLQECGRRGIHVLKEKPLARSLQEAREISRSARSWSNVVALGVQRRHTAALAKIDEWLAARRPPFVFEYTHVLGLAKKDSAWRLTRDQAGGGTILDLGYHAIDIITYLFGQPSDVYAVSPSVAPRGVETQATIAFRWGDDSNGVLLLGDFLGPEEERLRIWSGGACLTWSVDDVSVSSASGTEQLCAGRESTTDLLHAQLHDFVRCIRHGSSAKCTLDSAIATTATIDMCYRSLASSRCLITNEKESGERDIAVSRVR